MASVELAVERETDQRTQTWASTSTSKGASSWGELHDVSDVLLAPVARPWLSLYGARIRPIPGPQHIGHRQEDPALLHRVLSEDLLMEVFRRVPSWALGAAACVCRKWKYALRQPVLWRAACLKAWQGEGEEELTRVARVPPFWGSWRLMWLLRPRLRFEGLYVSRNTYIRCGIVEWTVKNPVHLVCYFRYLRFFPSGKFYYKTSPNFVRDVAKQLGAGHRGSKVEGFQIGRYTIVNDQVQAAIMYPGRRPTVLRMRLRLRGTSDGANNRMDMVSLSTSGMGHEVAPRGEDDDEVLLRCHDWEETHDPDVPSVSHQRGMSPYVFVPFFHADTDILNLPVDKMDFYLPG